MTSAGHECWSYPDRRLFDAYAREALLAGLVADATELVRTGARRDAFARYEHLIGRHMRTAPMRAVCAFGSRPLGAGAVAELACMPESSSGADVAFQLRPGPTSAEAVLDGEADLPQVRVEAA